MSRERSLVRVAIDRVGRDCQCFVGIGASLRIHRIPHVIAESDPRARYAVRPWTNISTDANARRGQGQVIISTISEELAADVL